MKNETEKIFEMGEGVSPSVVEFFKQEGFRRPPIRSSAMGTLDLCPRKFLYDEKLGLKPKGYSSSLALGDLYHEYRRCSILGMSEADTESSVLSKIAAYEKQLMEDAGKTGLLPNGQSLSSVLEELKDDLAVARAMSAAFNEVYPFKAERWSPMLDPEGVPLTEKLFEVQLPGIETPVKIKFDNVIVDNQSGTPSNVWIVDDKTTSLRPMDRASSMSFSNQISLYRAVLTQLIQGWGWSSKYLVVGSVHNVLKKPTIRYCGKDASFEAYVERVKKWYREQSEPPIIQVWTRFESSLFDPEFLSRLQEQDHASGSLPSIHKFGRRESSCFQYNRTCPFLPLCTTDTAMWPQLVELNYVRRFRDDDPENKT